MKKTFTNAILLTPFESIENGMVVVGADGLIDYAGSAEGQEIPVGEVIDLDVKYLAPGFIDIHTHGGNGVSFGEGDLEAGLEKYSTWAVGHGVCGFVLSITGPDANAIAETIRDYAAIFEKRSDWPGAIPLGLHLEGPFLNPEKHGAYNTDWIRKPSVVETRRYLDAGRGWIKHVSMAPELENADAVAKLLVENGVVVSLGHSNTDYETAAKALKGHFTHTTHTFNCMSGLHQRAPGVVGAVLASENVTTELTGDPRHVYPAAMKILYRCMGPDRMVLVTDAIAGAGLSDGKYFLMDQEVTIKDGATTLPDGSLGGSISTMDRCVRTMVEQVGVPLLEAVRMASYNPAKVIRENGRLGSIEVGKEANLVTANKRLEIVETFSQGKPFNHNI